MEYIFGFWVPSLQPVQEICFVWKSRNFIAAARWQYSLALSGVSAIAIASTGGAFLRSSSAIEYVDPGSRKKVLSSSAASAELKWKQSMKIVKIKKRIQPPYHGACQFSLKPDPGRGSETSLNGESSAGTANLSAV